MNCKECNEPFTTDNPQFLDTGRCLVCALRYRYCSVCSELFLTEDMRADMCVPCFRSNPVLADCHCRVNTEKKLGNGKRYFGVELEVEVSSKSKVKKYIKDIYDLMDDLVLLKHDGSLDIGIEIVTRPATLKKQYALWGKFFSRKYPDLRSFDTKTCGLHVHVSRDGLTDHTIAKAVCFVNSEANKKFMYVIAGRSSCDYTRFKNKPIREAHKYSGDRYEAINLSNEHTIEFRIFRGTLKKESLLKAIEFSDALLEYCSQTDSLSQSLSRSGFVRFVRTQNKWPHLLAFIQAKWYGVETELSQQIGWKPTNNCKVEDEYEIVFEE